MNSDFKDDVEVQNIPVPSRLPDRVDLRGLPSHILRSSAVEALNRQNEELLARLSVALRRLAQTEENLSEAQQTRMVLEHQLEVSKDQVLVLQEKDSLVEEKIRTLENDGDELRDQLSRMESLYAELYSSSRERTRSFTEAIEGLKSRVQRYQKYRRKIPKLIGSLRASCVDLKTRLTQQELLTKDVQSKLGQAADRIQALRRESDQNQRQLVETYEGHLTKKSEQVDRLTKESQALAQRVEHLEGEHQARLEAENLLVAERRNREAMGHQLQQTTTRLQSELAEVRAALKAMTVEAHRQTQASETALAQFTKAATDLKSAQEQVETLQALWNGQQAEIEQHKARTEALQKLNQELSSTINQQKREVAGLRHKLESFELGLATPAKIEMPSAPALAAKDNSPQNGASQAAGHAELNRVDQLFAEIQSGFNRQLPEDISPNAASPSSGTDSLAKGATGNP